MNLSAQKRRNVRRAIKRRIAEIQNVHGELTDWKIVRVEEIAPGRVSVQGVATLTRAAGQMVLDCLLLPTQIAESEHVTATQVKQQAAHYLRRIERWTGR